jgi:hypothetical protein
VNAVGRFQGRGVSRLTDDDEYHQGRACPSRRLPPTGGSSDGRNCRTPAREAGPIAGSPLAPRARASMTGRRAEDSRTERPYRDTGGGRTQVRGRAADRELIGARRGGRRAIGGLAEGRRRWPCRRLRTLNALKTRFSLCERLPGLEQRPAARRGGRAACPEAILSRATPMA